MQRFWESVIGPIFAREQPKSIVEIGALRGEHTAKLLCYCHSHNASLSVIDPFPAFHELQWGEELGRYMTLIREYSLNAMPNLSRYDVALIDGDHNWYTVYHELKEVEKTAHRNGGAFPHVFLHDTEWPYGRRDLYHNPSLIPVEYRQPYAQKGMVYGQSELAEQGGFNPGASNAVHENGPRNGVLTAIEDFLKETSFPLSLHRVASYNGLAILSMTDNDRDAFIEQVIIQSGL